MARANKSAAIDSAITAIKRGEFANYTNAAEKFKYDHNTLSQRIRGLIKSRKKTNLFYHQYLTIKQKERLITRINNLTDRDILPTSQIIKNLAKEIKGKRVRKN
jgi:hypothetical protein